MRLQVPPSLFGLPAFRKSLGKYRRKAEGDPPAPVPEPSQPKKPAKVVPANYQPTPEELEQDIEHPMPEEFRIGYRPPDTPLETPQFLEQVPYEPLPQPTMEELAEELVQDYTRELQEQSEEYLTGVPRQARKRFQSIFQSQENMAFVQDIKANPEDSSTRLIWADWLEEQGMHEYAETIRYQIAMMNEKDNFTNDQKNEMNRRIDRWSEEHPEWFGPWGWAGWWYPRPRERLGNATLDRGMLRIDSSVSDFAQTLQEQLIDNDRKRKDVLANVEQAVLDVNTQQDLLLLGQANNYWLENLNSVTLRNHGTIGPLYNPRIISNIGPHLDNLVEFRFTAMTMDDNGLDVLIQQADHLTNLRVLDLSDNLIQAPQSIWNLVSSPVIRNLRELYLQGNNLDEEALQAILEAPFLRNLTKLSLSINLDTPPELIRALQQRFPGDVLELHEEELVGELEPEPPDQEEPPGPDWIPPVGYEE